MAEGRLTFEDTTVIFGENDSGRSSMIEALVLALDGPDEAIDGGLAARHFHRTPAGSAGPIRIELELDEPAPRTWAPPHAVESAFPSADDRARRLTLEFAAALDPSTNTVTTSYRVCSPDHPGVELVDEASALAWLRRAFPVLWLKPGHLTDVPDVDTAAADHTLASDDAIRRLTEHHRRILTGDTLDMSAELEAGARAAEVVLDRFPHVFPGSGRVLSAMASEILHHEGPLAADRDTAASTPAQKLAVLLMLGAVAQLAGRALRAGPPSTDTRPIIVIENPEDNLHLTTLASVWGLIEGMAWQKIVATHSDTVLASAPITALRRLTRTDGVVREWAVAPDALPRDALRKIAYHLRSRRATAMFARCWILVEGETEYWVLPELARILGYDFAREGVACVEFAQSGLTPLLVLADQLGIAAHVFVDGDEAGRHYAAAALAVSESGTGRHHPLTVLREVDIEHCFWRHGFADVIRGIANLEDPTASTKRTIRKAIEKSSKPYLALSLIEAAADRGPASVPAVLAGVIVSAVHLARG